MLSGVHERLLGPVLSKGGYYRRGLHEIRPGSDHVKNVHPTLLKTYSTAVSFDFCSASLSAKAGLLPSRRLDRPPRVTGQRTSNRSPGHSYCRRHQGHRPQKQQWRE